MKARSKLTPAASNRTNTPSTDSASLEWSNPRYPACFTPPIPEADVVSLVIWLESRNIPCDNTLRGTREFLRRRKLPAKPTIDWLKKMGGDCDCEARLNIGLKCM